ncbi:sigma-70 family RNA polymerase sigma factor [Legionella cincinnatiensis]|uniref:RNA polymerase sigma factor FecI n=1 Tax=Legionella cincinnatiensis TaxID=28085 RepID=A0A378INE6_9GAMM|nr:sigma-70 family RNA polymerase sigma factor [Legionella cincinnatiensis]KTC85316.1 putative RNA polymerase sigma factor FecI [Legionella cincinnatiensis]STX36322.1 Probable RNA polymerase sigma factor fecI [Legionella cincinnatiensis]
MGKLMVQDQLYTNKEIGLVLITNRSFLVNLATTIIGSHSLSEDVVQDVYIKVMENNGTEPIRQPLRYLVRMVRNLAIDYTRRRAFECRLYVEEDDGINVPSLCSEPEIQTIQHDLLGRIISMLASLPLRTRTAFEMVRFDDCTLKETAAKLKVSQALVHFMVRDVTQRCLHYV